MIEMKNIMFNLGLFLIMCVVNFLTIATMMILTNKTFLLSIVVGMSVGQVVSSAIYTRYAKY